MKATRGIATTRSAQEQLLARVIANWPMLLLCLAAGVLLLWKLGAASLDDWDEAIYAQVSKEMVRDGRWLTPYWQYKPFFEKPPLFMWATALLYELFGVSELWARAASVMSGVGLLGITYLIGKRLYDKWAAMVAVVILLTSYQFVASARFGTTDVMLTLFIYLAVYGTLRLEEGSQRWWYLISPSCAFAIMTKSASGLLAPAVVMLALLVTGRMASAARSKQFWIGLLLAMLIVAPWHIWMLAVHGRAFINEYIGHHVIARSLSTLDEHTGNRLYYIDRLHKYFFPWIYLAPVALIMSFRENIKGDPRSRLLLILTLLVFVIYTASQTKLRWYILPIYPALSLMIASTVMQAIRCHESLAFSGLVMAAFAFMLIAPLPVALALVGLALSAALWFVFTRSLPYKAMVIIAFGFFLATGVRGLRPLYQGEVTPVAKLARIAGESGREEQRPLIVYSGLYRPSALFYSGRPIKVAYTIDYLRELTGDEQVKEIILAQSDINSLAPDYDINALQQAGPLVYASIRSRGAR